jgi:hypothetical protein
MGKQISKVREFENAHSSVIGDGNGYGNGYGW